jgi:hypothetical protein
MMQKQIQPNIFLSGWVCFFYLHLIHCNPNNVFMCWVKALSLAWALILVKACSWASWPSWHMQISVPTFASSFCFTLPPKKKRRTTKVTTSFCSTCWQFQQLPIWAEANTEVFFWFFYLREINIPTLFFLVTLGFNQYLNLAFSLLFGF